MRLRSLVMLACCLLAPAASQGATIEGDYLESRTCDIFTGPCFANAEVGLSGRLALMAWKIDRGSHLGVDLAGTHVVVALRASDTLGYGGGMVVRPEPIKSVILVDERATAEQRAALVDFARAHAGRVAGETVRVEAVPIEMHLDHVGMVAQLQAGNTARIVTRKLKGGDCVCTNEEVYYPPLANVENFEPAYTVAAGFEGKGLGVRWQHPSSRSTYLATFRY